MSFTDLMIDAGFSDEQEFMDYLEGEAIDNYDYDYDYDYGYYNYDDYNDDY